MRIKKSRKSRFRPIKSTENIFSVDNRSTMIFHKTSETRYQSASLSKNLKNINIDQL